MNIEDRFSPGRISLKSLYRSPSLEQNREFSFSSDTVKNIYGELSFPAVPADKPYCFGCFVGSADGQLVFPDTPDGSRIAKENRTDPSGADADFWVLNLLRSASDCVVLGTNTLRSQPDMTADVHDPALADLRIKAGLEPSPLHVVISRGEGEFPADHRIFTSGRPVIIASSRQGMQRISTAMQTPHHFSGMPINGSATLASCGEDQLDIPELLRILRGYGLRRMLIESPQFFSSLVQEDLAEELFLTTSSVYIGGGMHSLGRDSKPFPSTSHPSWRILSVHLHGEGFLFLRYGLDRAAAAYI